MVLGGLVFVQSRRLTLVVSPRRQYQLYSLLSSPFGRCFDRKDRRNARILHEWGGGWRCCLPGRGECRGTGGIGNPEGVRLFFEKLVHHARRKEGVALKHMSCTSPKRTCSARADVGLHDELATGTLV